MMELGLTDGFIELRSEHYVIRTLGPNDVTQRYVDWLNDPEVNRYLETRTKQTLESVCVYVSQRDRSRGYLFGIFAKEDGHIGNLSLMVEPLHGRGTLGVMVGERAYWGKSVVLETRAQVLNFAFDELGLYKVCAGCYAANTAAVYNFRRQNWQVDGVRKSHAIDGDGNRVDMVHFAMFRENWKQRHDERDN